MKYLAALFLLLVPAGAFAIVNLTSTDLEGGTGSTPMYWSVTDNADLEVSTDFTIVAWVRAESNPRANDSDVGIIAAKYNRTGNQRAYRLDTRGNLGTPTIQWITSPDGVNASVQEVAFTLASSTWYQLAVSYDLAGGNATFYVNGQQTGTTQAGGSTSIFNGTSPFEVGSATSDHTAAASFDGQIDEVEMFNDNLNPTQILGLYNKPCDFSLVSTSSTHRWMFDGDGNDATSTRNLTANNNAGATSSPAFSCNKGAAASFFE
jgi:hypothetical protein